MTLFRHIWHLATRFVGVVISRPLAPREQDYVNGALTETEAQLFWSQQTIDQRHAYQVARSAAALNGDRTVVVAALLHDVGKRHSKLGAIARSLATACDGVGIPLPERWQIYRDHGPLGARDLEGIGAEPLTVAFAAGQPTAGIDLAAWDALVAADNASGVRSRSSGSDGLAPKERDKGEPGNTMPPEVST